MKIILAKDEISNIQPGIYWKNIVLRNGSRLEVFANSRIEEKSVDEFRPIGDITKAEIEVLATAFQMQHKIPSEAICTVHYMGYRGDYNLYRYEWVEITSKGRNPEPTSESLGSGLGVDGAGISETSDATRGLVVGLDRPVAKTPAEIVSEVNQQVKAASETIAEVKRRVNTDGGAGEAY